MFRKFSIVLALIALVAVTLACGGSTSTPPPVVEAPATEAPPEAEVPTAAPAATATPTSGCSCWMATKDDPTPHNVPDGGGITGLDGAQYMCRCSDPAYNLTGGWDDGEEVAPIEATETPEADPGIEQVNISSGSKLWIRRGDTFTQILGPGIVTLRKGQTWVILPVGETPEGYDPSLVPSSVVPTIPPP